MRKSRYGDTSVQDLAHSFISSILLHHILVTTDDPEYIRVWSTCMHNHGNNCWIMLILWCCQQFLLSYNCKRWHQQSSAEHSRRLSCLWLRNNKGMHGEISCKLGQNKTMEFTELHGMEASGSLWKPREKEVKYKRIQERSFLNFQIPHDPHVPSLDIYCNIFPGF